MTQRRFCLKQIVWLLLCLAAVLALRLSAPIPTPYADLGTNIVFIGTEKTNSFAVAWGDWDNDGDLDLAVGNSGVNQVYENDKGILKLDPENGLGWQSTNDQEWTASVAWGDWDNDGDLDLAVGNLPLDGDFIGTQVYENDQGTLRLDPGNGFGWESSDGRPSYSVAWGDYDGDGDLDLAAGARVYENDAETLTCEPGSGLGWDSRSGGLSVAWGDWDDDGDLDLAVGYDGVNRVYENDQGDLKLDPDSGFGWESTGDEKETISVAWGDWDGDGDLDLAVGNSWDVSQVYENDGGMLKLDPDSSFGWESPNTEDTTSVAWGDWDGDGDLDLAVGKGVTQIYENDGETLKCDPGNNLGWESPKTGHISSLAWGDYDGDGDLDLAVGNGFFPGPGQQVNWIYQNDGRELSVAWEVADNPASVAWGDYDGDGDLDLAIGNNGAPNQVYENNGETPVLDLANGLGWESTEHYNTNSVAWGDWDGDGDLDLAVGNMGEVNQVYENDAGTLTCEPGSGLGWESTEADYTTSLAWGDWDGDGDLDLAIGNGGNADAQVDQIYENDGETLKLDPDSGFGWVSPDETGTTSVAWGDWDGDGDLDLAVGIEGYSNRVYENDGETLRLDPARGFGCEFQVSDGWTTSVAWGDWDGDGDLDLAVGNTGLPFGAVNQVYENVEGTLQCDPNHGIGWESTGDERYTASVAWGDWEGDGDLDLAVGNGYTGIPDVAAQVYENQEKTLNLAWTTANEGVAQGVVWGDWDGDGDLDLTVGTHIYKNAQKNNARLSNNTPSITILRPGTTDAAAFFSTPHIINSTIVPITYTLFDPEGDPVGGIIPEFSPDGGGQWFPATLATGTITHSLTTGRNLLRAALQAEPLLDGGTVDASLTISDDVEIADLDLRLNITHAHNADLEAVLISPSGTTVTLFSTGSLTGSHLLDTVLDDEAAAPITATAAPYTRSHQPLGSLAAFDGEMSAGTWTLRVTDLAGEGTGALASWGLRIQTPPVEHVFYWDAAADEVIKNDNLIFRIRVRSGVGPFQWPALDAKSPSFRIAAPQFVKVVDRAQTPVGNVEIYHNGRPIGATNRAGLLNPGLLEMGDSLVALSLQAEQPATRDAHDGWAYRTWLTNMPVDTAGQTQPFTVTHTSGEQRLTIFPTHTLVLFNLLVSIEWDATDAYLQDMASAMQEAADFLYDVTDGQMTFGQVAIYDHAEHWIDADIQVSAKNVVHPHAYVSGLSDDETAHLIRVGRYWNGSTGDEGDWSEPNGYKTLVHEFGHYGLGLYDEYFGYKIVGGELAGRREAHCTGPDNKTMPDLVSGASIMDYHYTTSELADAGRWTAWCQETAQHQLNRGETDWQTLARIYGDDSGLGLWQLVTPDQRAGWGKAVPGPDGVSVALPFPLVTTHNVSADDPEPFSLYVCYNGALYREGAWVTLARAGGKAMDQGLTDDGGQLDILGAQPVDSLQVVSLDGALSTSTQVVHVLAQGYVDLPPPPLLASQNGRGGPYLRLWPATDSYGDLEGLRLVVMRTLPGDSLDYVLTGPDDIGPSAAIPYDPQKSDHRVQVDFVPAALAGYAKAQGSHAGQYVKLNVDYRLQAVHNITETIYSNDGNLELHMDAGSLLGTDTAHLLIASPWGLPGPLPSGLDIVGEAYEITASDNVTHLDKPAVLRLRYDAQAGTDLVPQSLTIYRWDFGTSTWQPFASEIDAERQQIVTTVSELGLYALMSRPAVPTWSPWSLEGVDDICPKSPSSEYAVYLPFIVVTSLP